MENTFCVVRYLYDYGQEPVPEVTPQVWVDAVSREKADGIADILNTSAGKTDWVLTGSVFDPCYWLYKTVASSEAAGYPRI